MHIQKTVFLLYTLPNFSSDKIDHKSGLRKSNGGGKKGGGLVMCMPSKRFSITAGRSKQLNLANAKKKTNLSRVGPGFGLETIRNGLYATPRSNNNNNNKSG